MKYCTKCKKYQTSVNTDGRCYKCYSLCIDIKERLEYLRKQIENENISYGEIAELQGLKEYIDKDDVLLLEWAGVCEVCRKPQDDDERCGCTNKDAE